MRPFLVGSLLGSLMLLASAPAPAEAQRTGSSARGLLPGTGRIGTVPTAHFGIGVREPRITRYTPSDPFYRHRDPFRTRLHSRFPSRHVRNQHRPLPIPVVYYFPVTTERVIHVQTEVVKSRTITVTPLSTRAPSVESCAVVTVLEPDHRGYWKELRLPVAGARNTDELQRVLDARIEEGVAFTIRDAAGETLDVPPPAELDRIVVDRCR